MCVAVHVASGMQQLYLHSLTAAVLKSDSGAVDQLGSHYKGDFYHFFLSSYVAIHIDVQLRCHKFAIWWFVSTTLAILRIAFELTGKVWAKLGFE
jgi:hypothetical protein